MNATLTEKCTFLETIHLRNKTTGILLTVIFTSIINIVTAVTAIVGNAVFLGVFAKVSSIRSPSNVLLASLSVTDLIVGLIVQPASVARRILEFGDRHYCFLRVTFAFFGFLSCGASFLNIGLIGVDRCLAICCPFWYEISATNRSHITVISLVWFAWGVFTLLPFLGLLSLQVYFTGVFTVLILNIVVFLVSYGFILKVILTKKRSYVSGVVSSNANLSASYQTNGVVETPEICRRSDTVLCPENPVENRERKVSRKQQFRKSRVKMNRSFIIAVLLACMIICYAPQLTVLLVRSAFGDDEGLVFIADAWVDTITFVNSSVNPLIYCFRLTEIRAAVSKLFRPRTTPSDVASTTRGEQRE